MVRIYSRAGYKVAQNSSAVYALMGHWNSGYTLQNLDLRGLDLKGADFGGADFRGSDFDFSDLCDCNLVGARFGFSNSTRANSFREADFRGAKLDPEFREVIVKYWPSAILGPGRDGNQLLLEI